MPLTPTQKQDIEKWYLIKRFDSLDLLEIVLITWLLMSIDYYVYDAIVFFSHILYWFFKIINPIKDEE